MQSLLAAQWGVDVDHRKVSVVQVADDDEPAVVDAPAASTVAAVLQLAVSSGSRAEASISVEVGGTQGVGSGSGEASWRGQQRAVAEATLDALATLDPSAAGFRLGEVLVSPVGGESVVVVLLAGVGGGIESRACGAAAVGARGELHAVADAVLRAFRH